MGTATRDNNRQTPSPHGQSKRSRLLNSLGFYKAVMVRNPELRRRQHGLRNVMRSWQQQSSHTMPIRFPLSDTVTEGYSLTMSPAEVGQSSLQSGPSSVKHRTHDDDDINHSIIPNDHNIFRVFPIPNQQQRHLFSADTLSELLVEHNEVEFVTDGWDVNFVLDNDEEEEDEVNMYMDPTDAEFDYYNWLQEEEEDDRNDDPMSMDEIATTREGFPKLTRSTPFSTHLDLLNC